jgi:hypothetical protein
LYPPRTQPLGRHEERGQIELLLDSVANGPTGLALEGIAGIGKTTLVRDAIASASRRGYQVIATAPAEPDSSLAFAGLGDLFDRLPEDIAAALPDPQRRALGAALFVEDAAQAPADQQALPRAVLTVVRRLSATAPLLVAIDDEQWLDRPSARVLAFALCRFDTSASAFCWRGDPRATARCGPSSRRGSVQRDSQLES